MSALTSTAVGLVKDASDLSCEGLVASLFVAVAVPDAVAALAKELDSLRC